MKQVYDIAIIGGGAAGMAAAVSARKTSRDVSVLLLEKNEMLGRKIYATGNGRCNISNRAAYGCWDVLHLFEDLGMACYEDLEGRFYPASEMAEDAVYALESYIASSDIDVRLSAPVKEIEADGKTGLVHIESAAGAFDAKRVLLATGGKAAPVFGTTGDGFTMARKLGYTVNPVYPALTGIVTPVRGLNGVRARALARLYRRGEKIFEEYGQIQFTNYGLSGIVIFNMSRFVTLRDGLQFSDYELTLDLVPERIDAELRQLLGHRIEKGLDPFRGFVPLKLSRYLGLEAEHMLESGVDNKHIDVYFNLLRESRFPVNGICGWKMAQCTGGGIGLEQVNDRTMQSRLHTGLYFAGELLDECGPCGGFNLTQAFFTGLKAGKAMAAAAADDPAESL